MIVQWYLDQDINKDGPYNNYGPWKKSFWEINNEGREKAIGSGMQRLKTRLTGLDNPKVKCRSINSSTPRESHDNIFTVSHSGNRAENFFKNTDRSFLGCLPEEIIKWLADFPLVTIVVIESVESKMRQSSIDLLEETYSYYKTNYGINNKIIIQSICNNSIDTYSSLELPEYVSLAEGLNYIQHVIPSIVQWEEHADRELKNFKDPKEFTKKVLNYNGRWRIGRALIHSLVRDTFPIDDYRYSYRGPICNWQTKLKPDELISAYEKRGKLDPDTRNKLLSHIEEGPSGNVHKFKSVNYNREVYYRHFPNLPDYGDVFCEVLNETRSDREFIMAAGSPNMFMMTEKTFKPIAARRPFILSANGGYLNMLHELGFKTFDKWFDESYDNPELGLFESIDIIKKNLEFIESKSYEELLVIYNEMKPILDHNYTRMLEFVYRDSTQGVTNLEAQLNNLKW